MLTGIYCRILKQGYRTMMPHLERDFAEWFAEASHHYVEGHQACAWCGGRHCVFQTERDARFEYSCNSCDFYVCHDRQTGQYHAIPGSRFSVAPNPITADAC